ncbi:flagellar basal body-associated protein FliL [Microbulbifer harenosus]|uniref:Flagellar protein FliL n=1 Tax=Microbulbifer harenosus TaxID=2576840 RepID=A0ABY2UTE9_9GAMM|nr:MULTISPECIES: flagellar basal body-associated protein FliL [Microbulbifer]QIL89891.1 flagellar basal body-associated protein FliL [Microbulbifer sp. SH-1]TLM79975.1 flagellar basal body-associated protein FliL [Microbulbifer harenosus]
MAEETSGKSRGLLWLAIIAVLLIAALVAMNMYLLLRENPRATVEADAQSTGPVRADNPIFVKIDPFTVNLQGDQFANRLLYVGFSLQVGNNETRDFLLEHMPQVRSRLLILHSSQSPEALATLEGKQALVKGILATLAEPMGNNQPELLIDDVLFTEFIVQ